MVSDEVVKEVFLLMLKDVGPETQMGEVLESVGVSEGVWCEVVMPAINDLALGFANATIGFDSPEELWARMQEMGSAETFGFAIEKLRTYDCAVAFTCAVTALLLGHRLGVLCARTEG